MRTAPERPRRTEAELCATLLALERHAPDAEAVLRAVRDSRERHAPTLTAAPRIRRPARPRPQRGTAARLREWLIPLAAAAAVVAAVTVPLAIVRGHVPATGASSAVATGPGGAPPFYLAAPFDGRYAVIASTATGRTLATIKPPPGTSSIGPVGAAADDRTFVLAAATPGKGTDTEFFIVRFRPHTRTVSLTRLPFRFAPPSNTAVEFALSPDATRLAVIEFKLGAWRSVLAIRTYALATGSSQTWSAKIPGLSAQMAAEGWSADGQEVLVVCAQGLPGHVLAEAVNTSAPGTHLPPPTHLPIPSRLTRALGRLYVTPDGEVFLTTGVSGASWNLTEFSPHSGQLTHILGPVRRTKVTPSVDWSSNAGRVLIISGKDGGLGVLHDGHYLPIPLRGILRDPATWAVW
jgi:hypothetical protein